ncbi:hypothetical protein JTB14_009509 [Gonioctena quinquepunctata]|nr:hypothetical protein JTB14_009509 [Gonioctena quinquepunctata]
MIYAGRNKFELNKVFVEDEAPINKKLPKELLLRIFSYLDVVSLCRCAQVSKAWNILALDGSNWQRIDLFDFQKDVEGPIIENISRRCGGFLRQLSLRGCQSIVDGSMKTLAQLCPNVEDLNLNGCKKLTDSTCTAFSRHCSKLQKLNLDSCASITDNSLKALSDGCPNLTHINISWCSNITENGVEALARGCCRLKSFISKGCKQITSRAVICLARFCHQLEVVNLHGCNNIRDEAVQSLADKCTRLHYLCLSGCSALTDVSLIALASNCHLLSTLEVAGCSQFTDAAFQALARNCRYLEKMDLDECVLITDATLIHLAMGCPRIEYLTLSHCELITDEGIRHLSMSPCAAENLTVLELDNCPLVTDASLEHLTSCHNLQRVELYDCQLITRNGIRRLRNHLPNIKVHAYFAPVTPPPTAGGSRQRLFHSLLSSVYNKKQTMESAILKWVPDTWNKHGMSSSNWQKKVELDKHDEEYKQIQFEVRKALRNNSTCISDIERYQNIYDLGQVLIRGQLLLKLNPHRNYYQVRRFIKIKTNYLQTALDYNVDHRRCGLGSLTFQTYISEITSTDILFLNSPHSLVYNKKQTMECTLLKWVPDTWDKYRMSSSNWQKKVEVENDSEEFKQIQFEVRKALRNNSTYISEIQRNQNIYDLGQVLIRGQLLLRLNPHRKYYQVRRYIKIRAQYLKTALEYNVDHRRCGLDSLTFQSNISEIAATDILLVVQVLTSEPSSNNIEPQNSSDYYVEYIVKF